jgi:hypothetical protein
MFPLGMVLLAAAAVRPADAAAQQTEPFVVEYYYKVKWGHQDEWIRLFRKNHYPVLARQQGSGRILSVTGTAPRYHMTEDERWDYKVTITYRSLADAFAPGLSEAETRALYPDQDTFRREEQRRFELLIAHWDLPIVGVRVEP